MSRTPASSLRFQRMPAGGFVVDLGSDRFQLMWIGPGATHLHLASAHNLVPIGPDAYRVWDGTEKSARKAAAAFVADGTDENDD